MIHHGIKHVSGVVHHDEIHKNKSSDQGRVHHGVHGSGSVSSHAGQPPKIVDSGAKAFDDLGKARNKSHESKHEVHIKGKGFGGRVRG